MKLSRVTVALCAVVMSFVASSSHASLVGRDLDGNLSTAEAVYDTVADLTWLADSNYAQTSGYDADGLMTWTVANAWAASLDLDGVVGVDGWRLPDTLQPDASCDSQSGGIGYGYYCTGSEMGNLFYNVLGGTQVVQLQRPIMPIMICSPTFSPMLLVGHGVRGPIPPACWASISSDGDQRTAY